MCDATSGDFSNDLPPYEARASERILTADMRITRAHPHRVCGVDRPARLLPFMISFWRSLYESGLPVVPPTPSLASLSTQNSLPRRGPSRVPDGPELSVPP